MWANLDAQFGSRMLSKKRAAGGQPAAPGPPVRRPRRAEPGLLGGRAPAVAGRRSAAAPPPPVPAPNPFQRAQDAKRGKLRAAAGRSMATTPAAPRPGTSHRAAAAVATGSGASKKGRKKRMLKDGAGDAQVGSPATGREPASVVAPSDAAPLEPLVSSALPDVDQRFVYVGPLRSTDPEPLLQLFRPPSSGPICVSMLHDWSIGTAGKFLGVALVEYPSAALLKSALVSVMASMGPDGKAVAYES